MGNTTEKKHQIPAVISRFLHADESAISIESLVGGMSNQVFKVVTSQRELVFRMLHEHSALLGVNRENELAVYQDPEVTELTAKLVAYLPQEKLFVTEYLPGQTMVSKHFDDRCKLEKVIKTLKKLHRSKSVENVYFPLKHAVNCYRICLERGFDIPRGAKKALEIANDINRSNSPLRLVTCHNDLWLPNVLDNGDIYLLDFEYAGLNDPMFDLACLANNAQMSESSMYEMLALYFNHDFNRASAVLYNDLQASRAMACLRDALWSSLQAGLKGHDKLQQYSNDTIAQFFALLEHDVDLAGLV